MKNLLPLLILTLGMAVAPFLPEREAKAHHQRGHHCRANPHFHPSEFFKQKAERRGVKPKKIRKQHKHHKHNCKPGTVGIVVLPPPPAPPPGPPPGPPPPPPGPPSPPGGGGGYPPRLASPNSGGSEVSFQTEQPQQPALTVGVGLLAVAGTALTFLFARRLWAFKSRR